LGHVVGFVNVDLEERGVVLLAVCSEEGEEKEEGQRMRTRKGRII